MKKGLIARNKPLRVVKEIKENPKVDVVVNENILVKKQLPMYQLDYLRNQISHCLTNNNRYNVTAERALNLINHVVDFVAGCGIILEDMLKSIESFLKNENMYHYYHTARDFFKDPRVKLKIKDLINLG